MIVNKRGLADAFGVSEETITQWQKAGMPIQTARKGTMGNEYELAPCIRWYALRESGGDGALDLNQERARLAKAQADKTELEAAELKGEMVRYEELSAHWAARGSAMRSRLLTLPTKIAPRARVAENDQAASALIEAEIIEALTEISGNGVPDSTSARRQRSERLSQAPSSSNGVGVGGSEQAAVKRKRSRTRPVEN